MKQIGIYGAGGFAREVAWLVSMLNEIYEFVSYIDDSPTVNSLRDVPVRSFEEFRRLHPDALVALAVGNPRTRAALALKCADAGVQFATLQHYTVECSHHITFGEGSIVCAGSILTTDIWIGDHVHINLDCTIGHDARIDPFATLAPGVHVSGNVHIGRGAYIGTGANIINGTHEKPLVIGKDAVIAAGACVTDNCEPGWLYAGVPAVQKKRY